MRNTLFLLLVLLLIPSAVPAGNDDRAVWTRLATGLELARFDTRTKKVDAAGDLLVLRVDPDFWELRCLQAGSATEGQGLKLPEWGKRFGLVAAINAGMYQADRLTHVGFSQVGGRVTNSAVNDYQSALAFDAVNPTDVPFGIFDLDETPLGELRRRFRTVVQNLRLVKHSGENRWQPLGSQWAEAALGEDDRGRPLFLYCSTPLSMYEFNEVLLALPLELVAAQHLEGRSQARIWIDPAGAAGAVVPRNSGPVLPNVIGITRRTEEE